MKELVTEWHLGNMAIELRHEGEGWVLFPKTADFNLLRTLADIGYPIIARCALDVIFQDCAYGPDIADAMEAYVRKPLSEPPAPYLEICRKVNWERESAKSPKAVILAGSNSDEDQESLLHALRVLPENMRDGPILAASSFRDRRFIEAIVELAMSLEEFNALATGELREISICFNTWRNCGFLSLKEVDQLLRRHESNDRDLMRATRLMNYIVCPTWDQLPYPAESSLRI